LPVSTARTGRVGVELAGFFGPVFLFLEAAGLLYRRFFLARKVRLVPPAKVPLSSPSFDCDIAAISVVSYP